MEDGLLTHGEMDLGAGTVAQKGMGKAWTILDLCGRKSQETFEISQNW